MEPNPSTLLVPTKFAQFAKSCASKARLPVEVQTYARLTATQLKRLQKECIILVADLEQFAQLAKQNTFSPDVGIPGKALLMTDREDWPSYPFLLNRCFDIVAEDISQRTLAFKVSRFIQDLKFDSDYNTLKDHDLKAAQDLNSLNEIGMALSTEKDLEGLLDLIISRSREMTWADAGTLYLVEADPNLEEDPKDFLKDKKMRFAVAQTESRDVPFKSFTMPINKASIQGYVAITQRPLNFADVYDLDPSKEYKWGGREFDALIKYRNMSMLTVPMVNYRGETIGILQLINRKKSPGLKLGEPETIPENLQPFTDYDEKVALSIASQASIAIQNTQLVDSIKGLFDGFIAASVRAIEARDPTTGGHSQRVATLTVALAEQVDRSQAKKFKEFRLTEETLQEIRYASLLHDFGKIGVRENVLIKAKKLFPHELQAIQDRFNLIRSKVQLKSAEKQVSLFLKKSPVEAKALMESAIAEREQDLGAISEALEFILQCNEPTVLAQGGFDQLNEIAARNFFQDNGEKIPFLNEKELNSLSVPKGSLTVNDRKEIESHVTHTYRFLSTIPWTQELRNVPEIAYAHHEKLDGTGYPNGLDASQIPIQAKMMTIADIFDALTAMDRPYKKALPAERALNILLEEAKASHVDTDLLKLFIESEIYQLVF